MEPEEAKSPTSPARGPSHRGRPCRGKPGWLHRVGTGPPAGGDASAWPFVIANISQSAKSANGAFP